jgi:hypothetical protein
MEQLHRLACLRLPVLHHNILMSEQANNKENSACSDKLFVSPSKKYAPACLFFSQNLESRLEDIPNQTQTISHITPT